jgi:hypothetical protein
MKKEYKNLLDKISRISKLHYWKTKDGRKIPVPKLETIHLLRILLFLKKKAWSVALTKFGTTNDWRECVRNKKLLEALENEIEKRGYPDWEMTLKTCAPPEVKDYSPIFDS